MEVRVAPAPRWAEQREGRALEGSAAGHSQERQTKPRTPSWASAFFFFCLPSSTREMKLLGWATEAAETQLLRRSGVPCLGCPSHPDTHNGSWGAINQSSPECKHLR